MKSKKRKKLPDTEVKKTTCKSGNKCFVITQKQDGSFHLYQVYEDGFVEINTKGKVKNPCDFDKLIWPQKNSFTPKSN